MTETPSSPRRPDGENEPSVTSEHGSPAGALAHGASAEGAPTDGASAEREPDGDPPEDDERVPITPTLVVLGILAVALGVFSALVMSAQSLAP